jgi:hypothetical protein
MYQTFLKKYYDETNPITEIAQFKLFLQLELEKRLSNFPEMGIDDPADLQDGIKIAQITFAFQNSKIINMLKKRGQLRKTEKWEQVEKMNAEIAESLRTDQDLLDKMQRPCSVFATFETEEGYNRALRYNELVENEYHAYESLLGCKIDIQEASEPTDIIWENRAFTDFQRRVKRVIVYFLVVVMLAISAGIIFYCTLESNRRKFRYPKVECADIQEEYGCDPTSFQC